MVVRPASPPWSMGQPVPACASRLGVRGAVCSGTAGRPTEPCRWKHLPRAEVADEFLFCCGCLSKRTCRGRKRRHFGESRVLVSRAGVELAARLRVPCPCGQECSSPTVLVPSRVMLAPSAEQALWAQGCTHGLPAATRGSATLS